MNHVLILAAGRGTRMDGDVPKALVQMNGRPLVDYVIDTVSKSGAIPTIVIGYKGGEIIKHTGDKYHYVWQIEQLGTGHAVLAAKSELKRKRIKNLVVVYADTPFIEGETISKLIGARENSNAPISIGVVKIPNYEKNLKTFYHFGRILRDAGGNITKVVEFKDATEDEKKITEINPAFYCFDASWLWKNIDFLKNDNKAHEYYLTDLIGIALSKGSKVADVQVSWKEGMGINSLADLAMAAKYA